ncbi:MAG: MFS transporter [Reyranellaceae bacterium]
MTNQTLARGARTGLSLLFFRVYLPFALGYFLSYLYRTVNAVISKDVTRDLSLDAADLGLLTSAYFISFAAFQLPLGLLLDRFGPRRVHACLLAVAASGAFLFSVADSLAMLFLARALIGMGVAGGLMAAFKAISIWFPPERWALINGFHLAFGGLGAMSATAPVELALHYTDWRGVFVILSVVTVGVALFLVAAVPEKPETHARSSLGEALAGVALVFRSRAFWRLAPAVVMSQASFMSIQTLWTGPWLRDVAGLDRATTSEYLLAIAASMTCGFLMSGVISGALTRRGVKPMTTLCAGYMILMLLQVPIVLGFTPSVLLAWMLYGFFGVTGVLCFPILTHMFPLQLSGRVTTSCNMLMFAAAFALQYGMGEIISLWQRGPEGAYPAIAYSAAFAVALALQAVTYVWLILPQRQPAAG